MAQDAPNNGMDLIDSRDIIERIESLELDLEIAADMEANKLHQRWTLWHAWKNKPETYLDEGEQETIQQELKILKAVEEEAEGSASDWRYGETLIRCTYFKEYAQELAEDCGMVTKDSSWPNDCLDWDRAARELKIDYTTVDYDGIEYWIRAY
jgi:CRISPR/Cas system-associated endonuclease Cas1